MSKPPEPGRPTVRRGRSFVSIAAERVIELLIRACGFSAIFFVFAILVFVIGSGADFIVHRLDIGQFLFSTEWVPTSVGAKRYGTFALTAGSFFVTLLAMAIAVPFGVGAAVFVSEFTSGRSKEILKVTIELLAAIPSVVWGFIGLVLINPMIIALFDAPIGLNVLNGGLILGLMSVPIIVSIGEDALKAVPDSYREAALAMGATRWQMITSVLLPAARNGLLAAVLLGVARAIGETIAVLMATGHAVQIPHSPLDSVRTLTATIAAELGEAARGSDHYQALFAVGALLFTLTFIVNLSADLIVRGRKASR